MFLEKATNISRLETVATKLIAEFKNQRIFAIYGKMGAGKTTFIQAICKVLGTKDNVTSPTFAIINEYQSPESIIFHFDFYRIKDLEEAYDMGYEDYIYSGNYCLIEWPEMIKSLLPENRVDLTIEVLENDERLITAEIR